MSISSTNHNSLIACGIQAFSCFVVTAGMGILAERITTYVPANIKKTHEAMAQQTPSMPSYETVKKMAVAEAGIAAGLTCCALIARSSTVQEVAIKAVLKTSIDNINAIKPCLSTTVSLISGVAGIILGSLFKLKFF
jgi:hypothetical protein